MAEGTARTNRRGRELHEGMGSGSGGDGQAHPDDRRDGYGQRLDPPPEVRVPAAPLRKNPLIRKRLAPAVNTVEHDCYGNACTDEVKESPIQDGTVALTMFHKAVKERADMYKHDEQRSFAEVFMECVVNEMVPRFAQWEERALKYIMKAQIEETVAWSNRSGHR